MKEREVYVAMGGNIGEPAATFDKVLAKLAENPAIGELKSSPYYITSPVSDIPQRDYLNAVCRFVTPLAIEELVSLLREIEEELGKRPKIKTAPRIIDLDLLFYGGERRSAGEVEVPHPHWQERLFVLQPLSDLAEEISLEGVDSRLEIFRIRDLIANFKNVNNEKVALFVEGAVR